MKERICGSRHMSTMEWNGNERETYTVGGDIDLRVRLIIDLHIKRKRDSKPLIVDVVGGTITIANNCGRMREHQCWLAGENHTCICRSRGFRYCRRRGHIVEVCHWWSDGYGGVIISAADGVGFGDNSRGGVIGGWFCEIRCIDLCGEHCLCSIW